MHSAWNGACCTVGAHEKAILIIITVMLFHQGRLNSFCNPRLTDEKIEFRVVPSRFCSWGVVWAQLGPSLQRHWHLLMPTLTYP